LILTAVIVDLHPSIPPYPVLFFNFIASSITLFFSLSLLPNKVFISYGKQSNDRLLQYYGFIDPDNPHDIYDFGVGFLELILKYADAIGEAFILSI
jgi:hypothetical protein